MKIGINDIENISYEEQNNNQNQKNRDRVKRVLLNKYVL